MAMIPPFWRCYHHFGDDATILADYTTIFGDDTTILAYGDDTTILEMPPPFWR